MPGVLLALNSPDKEGLEKTLSDHGYRVTTVHSSEDLLQKVVVVSPCPYSVIVVDAAFIFDKGMGRPDLLEEIAEKVPNDSMFPRRLLVFFTYWDKKAYAEVIVKNRYVNAIMLPPFSSEDLFFEVRKMLWL